MRSGTRKTLYSELGVAETAAREEVRAAYWQKAKAWHPDKATSEDERAENVEKMSRLNEIMDVLGDDEKRAGYDDDLSRIRAAEVAGLRRVSVAASIQAWRGGTPSSNKNRLFYGGASILIMAIGWVAALLMRDSIETQWWQSHSSKPVAANPATTAREHPAPEKPGLPPPAPVRESQPGVASRTTDAPGTNATVPREPEVSPLVEEARRALERKREVPKIQQPTAPPTPALASSPSSPTVAYVPPAPSIAPPSIWNGHWRYSPALGGKLGGVFTPLSIEMQLSTRAQKVYGTYKARYHVTQRKYSDRVEFSFEGWADSEEVIKGVWQDPTGSRGEFQLKRVSGNVVEMNWWTTAIGRKNALASGIARLKELEN